MKLAVIGNNPAKIGHVNKSWTMVEIERVLVQLDPDAVYVGMARGADLWTAQICHALGLPYHAVLPHPHQSAKWSEADRILHTELLETATSVTWVTDGPRPMSFLDKNTALVEVCDEAMVVWDGVEDGGTWHGIQLLARRNRPYVWINPVRRRTVRRTPRKESNDDRRVA